MKHPVCTLYIDLRTYICFKIGQLQSFQQRTGVWDSCHSEVCLVSTWGCRKTLIQPARKRHLGIAHLIGCHNVLGLLSQSETSLQLFYPSVFKMALIINMTAEKGASKGKFSKTLLNHVVFHCCILDGSIQHHLGTSCDTFCGKFLYVESETGLYLTWRFGQPFPLYVAVWSGLMAWPIRYITFWLT